MHNLKDKRALVCGSTRGIGRACAEELARQGAAVTLVARDEAALARTARSLSADAGQKHDYVCADFGDPAALKEKVAAHIARTAAYHVLINNTGGPSAGPIVDATPEQFITALTNHVVCNQLLTQCVMPGMKEARYGRIVNIISTSVKAPIPGLGVSNTTRGAVASWAKTMAGELGPFGITVNNVLPGFTGTDRLTELLQWKAERSGVKYDDLVANIQAEIPARRFAEPSEIAAAVAFLASDDSSFITASNFLVDGGISGAYVTPL